MATAGLTAGAFKLVEDVRAQGEGPAPHIHKRSDEAFYVLAGRFAFTRGDQEMEATRELDSLLERGLTSAQAMATPKGKYDSDPA